MPVEDSIDNRFAWPAFTMDSAGQHFVGASQKEIVVDCS